MATCYSVDVSFTCKSSNLTENDWHVPYVFLNLFLLSENPKKIPFCAVESTAKTVPMVKIIAMKGLWMTLRNYIYIIVSLAWMHDLELAPLWQAFCVPDYTPVHSFQHIACFKIRPDQHLHHQLQFICKCRNPFSVSQQTSEQRKKGGDDGEETALAFDRSTSEIRTTFIKNSHSYWTKGSKTF